MFPKQRRGMGGNENKDPIYRLQITKPNNVLDGSAFKNSGPEMPVPKRNRTDEYSTNGSQLSGNPNGQNAPNELIRRPDPADSDVNQTSSNLADLNMIEPTEDKNGELEGTRRNNEMTVTSNQDTDEPNCDEMDGVETARVRENAGNLNQAEDINFKERFEEL